MSSVKVISNLYEVLSNYLSIYYYSAHLSLGNFTVVCSDLLSQTILQIFLKEVKNTASA